MARYRTLHIWIKKNMVIPVVGLNDVIVIGARTIPASVATCITLTAALFVDFVHGACGHHLAGHGHTTTHRL